MYYNCRLLVYPAVFFSFLNWSFSSSTSPLLSAEVVHKCHNFIFALPVSTNKSAGLFAIFECDKTWNSEHIIFLTDIDELVTVYFDKRKIRIGFFYFWEHRFDNTAFRTPSG